MVRRGAIIVALLLNVQHGVVFPSTSIHLTVHFTSAIHGHVAACETVVAQSCLSNEAFSFFWALCFHELTFTRKHFYVDQGQVPIGAVFT